MLSLMLNLMAEGSVPDSSITTAIDRFGLPLVICAVLAYYIRQLLSKNDKREEARDLAFTELSKEHHKLAIRTALALEKATQASEEGNEKLGKLIEELEKRPCQFDRKEHQ